MSNQFITKLGVLSTSILAIPAISFAGTASAGKDYKDHKPVIEKCKESCITGDIGLDVYSKYIFHGLTLENQGAILQPYADIYFKLYSGEGALTDVSLNLGIWNSFKPAAVREPSYVTNTWCQRLTFTPFFAVIFTPSCGHFAER